MSKPIESNGRDGRSQERSPSALKFTPPVLTKAEILNRGNQASLVLQSPVFGIATRSTVQALQDQITATQPHESQKREWLNLQVHALAAVLDELSSMYAEAAGLSQNILAEEELRQRELAENRGFAQAN
jgi:hypothetical protein